MLAHFSTSSAAEEVRKRVAIPAFTSPNSAVQLMKSLIAGQ